MIDEPPNRGGRGSAFAALSPGAYRNLGLLTTVRSTGSAPSLSALPEDGTWVTARTAELRELHDGRCDYADGPYDFRNCACSDDRVNPPTWLANSFPVAL